MNTADTAILNLPQRQVMLSLAYLAYCGDQIITPQPEIQILDYINKAIPQIPVINTSSDQWQVVWGPRAYTTPGSLYQDNMMFVAQNQKDTTQFAIAIRGTNFVSDLDWLMEDLDILRKMPWPPGMPVQDPPYPMISESTSIGLQVLLNMTSNIYGGSASNNTALSLLEFLLSQTSGAISLCVTGHSLGGCLAGTLALYLKESVSAWDQSGNSIVSCITFAAPTAGDVVFADYSDSRFSNPPQFPPDWDSSLGTTFDAVRCSLDVAPLCWTASNITTNTSGTITSPIFSLYVVPNDYLNEYPEIDFTEMDWEYSTAWTEVILPYILPIVTAEVTNQNYSQVVSDATPLQGTINATYTIYDDTLENTLAMFIQQATYQHSQSYPVLLNVPELNDPSIIVENPYVATSEKIKRTKTILPRLISRLVYQLKR